TDGSFHGYALTYAPSLTPASLSAGAYTRDSLLPELRRRMKARDDFEVFDYGNFDTQYEERDITDTVKGGWYSYDHRPRFGTNFFGLRQRCSILSEAYSHDPFERRVKSTYAFVHELLSLVAERGPRMAEIERSADAAFTRGDFAGQIPIRAQLTTKPDTLPIIFEVMAHTGDSSLTQPGVPRGFRRTGDFRTRPMPVYVRFDPTASRSIPGAWILPAADTAAVSLLRLHGVVVEHPRPGASGHVSEFVIDSVHTNPREFQKHHESSIFGRWRTSSTRVSADMWMVRGNQKHAVVAMYLLDPESDDGLATWNVFDRELTAGGTYPVRRLLTRPDSSP
ncbi:MAG: hypothetical protein ACRENC_14865, partial [Gemmatimonadaceae bacterium]